MIAPILSTKFYIPRPRKNLVIRQRLFAKLNEGVYSKLILVSAPAGYGKTTLITSWLDGLSLPVTWISLDAGDNDYYRFFTYFLKALTQANPQFGETLLQMIQSGQPPSQESLTTLLLNEIAIIPVETILVIDDYHLIQNSAIHQTFQQIVDNSPPQLHFIICSRSELPFSVSRLRSRYDLLELTQKELSLNLDESARYLNLVMGLILGPDEIAILHDRTEGWLVGLQLAALSLRDHTDPAGFIRSIKGDNRYVTDYLVDEVLSLIPEDLQDFLLRTSVLSQMEASLCDTTLQINNSQVLLETLDKKRLFIIPLDDNRRWFRYHHLFGEMLHDRLMRRSPEILPSLYQRASAWYAGHKMKEDAVDYSLAAGDYDEAAGIIKEIGLALLSKGEWDRLLGWYDQFPPEDFLRRNDLWLNYFMTQINAGLITTASRKLREINLEVLDKKDFTEAELARTKGELASMQGVIDLHSRADPASAKNNLSIAIKNLTGKSGTALNFAMFNYGAACTMLGQIDEARLALGDSTIWYKMNEFSLGIVMGTSYLAATTAMKGELRLAYELFQDAERFARKYGLQEGAVSSKANLGLGKLYYEWNQLDQAANYLTQGIRLAEQGGYLEQLLLGYVDLARIQELEGDLTGVHETIRRARRMSEKYGDPPQVVSFIEAVKADLSLQRGDLINADGWASTYKLPASGKFDLYSQYNQTVLLRLLVTKGDRNTVNDVIKPLREQAIQQGRVADSIALDVIYAKYLYMSGQPSLAIEILQKALSIGEPERFVRTFLDEGGVIVSMIKQLLASGESKVPNREIVSPDYLHFLLGEVANDTLKATSRQTKPHGADGIEPLTERELHVLHLVESGYTNKQIAQEMIVSLNTVKFHLKNIYGKLGVDNRTRAARAFRKKD
jgi:LuxR family transcriptional regulator, maltose regulon positive regulatory protein